MAPIYLGNRVEVTSAIIYKHKNGRKKLRINMDGRIWDSCKYHTMRKFFQAIINHQHRVCLGKD